MPKFNAPDITVDPEDFWESCNSSDRERLKDFVLEDYEIDDLYADYNDRNKEKIRDIVMEDWGLVYEDDVIKKYGDDYTEDPRSVTHQDFNYHLRYLRNNGYSVSVEDMAIVAIIAKKYGAR